MGILGNQPADKYTSFAKQDFTVTATTSYTLDHSVSNENEIALFINFVRQEPTTAYTASGTSLTLTEATSVGDDMYCVFLGKAVQTVTPALSTITNDMLAETITVANGGTGLTSGFKNGITEADQWRLTTNFDITGGGSGTDITANLERVDEPSSGYIGTGMTESSGIFTFPQTGIYKVEAVARFFGSAAFDWGTVMIYVTQDNSTYDQGTEVYTNKGASQYASQYSSLLVDVTDTTQVKVKFSAKASADTTVSGRTDENHTFFTFMRLGDT